MIFEFCKMMLTTAHLDREWARKSYRLRNIDACIRSIQTFSRKSPKINSLKFWNFVNTIRMNLISIEKEYFDWNHELNIARAHDIWCISELCLCSRHVAQPFSQNNGSDYKPKKNADHWYYNIILIRKRNEKIKKSFGFFISRFFFSCFALHVFAEPVYRPMYALLLLMYNLLKFWLTVLLDLMLSKRLSNVAFWFQCSVPTSLHKCIAIICFSSLHCNKSVWEIFSL